MPPTLEGDWQEWGNHVLLELQRYGAKLDEHGASLVDIQKECAAIQAKLKPLIELPEKVNNLKVKVAALGGGIAILVSIGAQFIMRAI